MSAEERGIQLVAHPRALKLARGCRQTDSRLFVPIKVESENIVPLTVDLVAAGATLGDIVEKLKTLRGTYREQPMF